MNLSATKGVWVIGLNSLLAEEFVSFLISWPWVMGLQLDLLLIFDTELVMIDPRVLIARACFFYLFPRWLGFLTIGSTICMCFRSSFNTFPGLSCPLITTVLLDKASFFMCFFEKFYTARSIWNDLRSFLVSNFYVFIKRGLSWSFGIGLCCISSAAFSKSLLNMLTLCSIFYVAKRSVPDVLVWLTFH